MGFYLEELGPETVEDAMTSTLITIEEETPIPEVAARMVQCRIHRVIVVDADQQLQGIITSLDVLRWVAEAVRFDAEPTGRRSVSTPQPKEMGPATLRAAPLSCSSLMRIKGETIPPGSMLTHLTLRPMNAGEFDVGKE